MSDFREDLLTAILDCGYGDLYLLEDCKYDLGEIVEDCMFCCGRLDINTMVRFMFERGLQDLETAINDRICEIEAIQNERELDDDEQEELSALGTLNPSDDFRSFHNYIDTHIWLDDKDKRWIYHDYLSDALDSFADMTGFCICLD